MLWEVETGWLVPHLGTMDKVPWRTQKVPLSMVKCTLTDQMRSLAHYLVTLAGTGMVLDRALYVRVEPSSSRLPSNNRSREDLPR